MTEVKPEQMRARLIELRAELEYAAATGADSAAVVELDQSKFGRLSRMDAMQAQAMAQASTRRRADMLRKIAVALQRIEDDEYGYCAECGTAINPNRLQFDPTVLFCIECASKREP